MAYLHMPKAVVLWAALALLIPAPRAFSQTVQDEPQGRERSERECAGAHPDGVASGRPSPTPRSIVPSITLESLPKLYGPGTVPPNATSDDLSLR
jgi:hypothetical protein